ncbi:MAG: hypothetical protein J5927_02060 [Oscillospiraceae bacterium]|nr:hypothetical protein [Oscillospiraceae bacterium]
MIEIYREEYMVPEDGLSTRELFRALQTVSAAQCEGTCAGKPELDALGLMWVAIRQYVTVSRWPGPGEKIRVETWPGQTRHSFFYRYYRVQDEAGETVLDGSSLWSLVDRESRKMVAPGAYGIDLPCVVTGWEIQKPPAPRKSPVTETRSFIVPEDYLDSNGHMNNTRYYDLAEQCIGVKAERVGLREAVTEYINEALGGEEFRVSWGFDGQRYYVTGEADDGHVFRMSLLYGDNPGE